MAEHVTPDSALRLFEGVSRVVEGSDNLATKFLVADACATLGIPVVHGACVGWVGTVLPVVWRAGACYRCVFEDLPLDDGSAASCVTAGVYGPVTSVVGALMAADALSFLAGDTSRAGHLGRYDGWAQSWRSTPMRARADCPLCRPGAAPPTLTPDRYGAACGDV